MKSFKTNLTKVLKNNVFLSSFNNRLFITCYNITNYIVVMFKIVQKLVMWNIIGLNKGF